MLCRPCTRVPGARGNGILAPPAGDGVAIRMQWWCRGHSTRHPPPFPGKEQTGQLRGREGRNPGQVQAADPRGRAHGPQPSPSTRSAHHVSEQMNPQIAARLPAFLGASGCADPWALAGTKPDRGPPANTPRVRPEAFRRKAQTKGALF